MIMLIVLSANFIFYSVFDLLVTMILCFPLTGTSGIHWTPW